MIKLKKKIKINNKKQHCSLKNTIQRENREDEQYRKLVAALFLSLLFLLSISFLLSDFPF
jgi:hypothetical protein